MRNRYHLRVYVENWSIGSARAIPAARTAMWVTAFARGHSIPYDMPQSAVRADPARTVSTPLDTASTEPAGVSASDLGLPAQPVSSLVLRFSCAAETTQTVALGVSVRCLAVRLDAPSREPQTVDQSAWTWSLDERSRPVERDVRGLLPHGAAKLHAMALWTAMPRNSSSVYHTNRGRPSMRMTVPSRRHDCIR